MKRLFLPFLALACLGPCQAQSLYSEATFRPLIADQRARKAGDILTVLVYETSSASTSADTALKRRADAGLSASLDSKSHRATVGTVNDFDGGGTVNRSGRLLATLSITVVEVAENGDLRVSGEQHVDINSEHQHFRIEGRVRPVDIANNNAVLSTRIADARITYLGDGELAERQRPGWLTRILTWLGF